VSTLSHLTAPPLLGVISSSLGFHGLTPPLTRSRTFRQWVTREEAGQPFCHARRIDDLEPVCDALKHEGFRLGQPGLHQVVPLDPTCPERMAVRPEHGEDRLGDAPGLRRREAPLLERREFDPEERIGVGHGLGKGARQHAVQHAAVLRPHHGSEEAVDPPAVSPASYIWSTGPMASINCGALGTINSAGSSSAREWTASGASSASCNAMEPP
jgi:hypothetical protein